MARRWVRRRDVVVRRERVGSAGMRVQMRMSVVHRDVEAWDSVRMLVDGAADVRQRQGRRLTLRDDNLERLDAAARSLVADNEALGAICAEERRDGCADVAGAVVAIIAVGLWRGERRTSGGLGCMYTQVEAGVCGRYAGRGED